MSLAIQSKIWVLALTGASSAIPHPFSFWRSFYGLMTMLTEVCDDELMANIALGSEEMFNDLVERWRGWLCYFLRGKVKDAQLAEDISQQVFLRIYRGSHEYQACGEFRAWMCRIALNLVTDDFRRRSRDAMFRTVRLIVGEHDARNASEQLPHVGITVDAEHDSAAAEAELRASIEEVLATIIPEQAEVYRLYVFSEKSLMEIADLTNSAYPTVKSRWRLVNEKVRYGLSCRGYE
tara:strand:+ start:1866 stop:2573 length:708 start_codon:yes stop_codon:yes gene_type:complete